MPTVVTGLTPTARCSREEIFGPVLVVHRFTDEQQVTQWANNTSYGTVKSGCVVLVGLIACCGLSRHFSSSNI
jgi:hypothetical protein